MSTIPEDSAAEWLTAAAYGRISEDDDLKGEGVNEQLHLGVLRIESDPRWMLTSASWPATAPAGTFRDDDISAYSRKPPPGYGALMREVVAGRVKVIVVRHLDRLWRDDVEAAQGRKLLRQHRVSVVEYRGGTYDMWTAHGQHMARTMGGNATFESDMKSERVKEAAERRANQGRMNGPCPYGWRREDDRSPSGRVLDSREVEDPEAAAVVREIVRRLLAGDSLLAVTRDLNERGVRPPGADFQFRKKARAVDNPDGGRWSKTSVKKLALRESNAGLRIFHKGEPDQREIEGAWPALVSKQDWRRVVALLGAQERQVSCPANRQHLLTWGIGVCGVCGGHLRMAHRTKARVPYYICAPEGCVGRREDYVDALVGEVVTARLSRPDALDWLTPDSDALADATKRAQEARERPSAAGVKLAAGEWTVETVDAVTAATRPKLEQAEADIRRLTAASDLGVLAEMAGPTARQRWADASLALRRAILEALGLRVLILRTGGRGPGFDPASVRFDWTGRQA